MPSNLIYYGGGAFEAGSPAQMLYDTWANAFENYQARTANPRTDVWGQTLREDTPTALSEELFTPVEMLADAFDERPSYRGYSRYPSNYYRQPSWQTRSLPGGGIVQVNPEGQLRTLREPTERPGEQAKFDVPIGFDPFEQKPTSTQRMTREEFLSIYDSLPDNLKSRPEIQILKRMADAGQAQLAPQLSPQLFAPRPQGLAFAGEMDEAGLPVGENLFAQQAPPAAPRGQYPSAEAVREAFRSGRINRLEALTILREQFGAQ